MDTASIVEIALAALTCACALYAAVTGYRANDYPDFDVQDRLKRLSHVATISAVSCGVLTLLVTGGFNLYRSKNSTTDLQPIAGNSPIPPSSTNSTDGTIAQSGIGAQALPSGQVGWRGDIPPTADSKPMAQPLYDASGQATYERPISPTAYVWDAPPKDREANGGQFLASERPQPVVCPYNPVSFTVVMRFSTEDPAIKPYIDRVLHQAEKDSGIGLTRSHDKFASLHVTPLDEVVYADGKQARLAPAKVYVARTEEKSAYRYLFEPQIHVTVVQSNGSKASFSKKVTWNTTVINATKQYPDSDAVDLYVFPKRKRVVLTVTASSVTTDCQFAEGAPSVYDLRGGSLAAQLLRVDDIAEPKILDLDDVDRNGGEESARLEASLAPRIHPTVASILCAASPPGSVELGVEGLTIQKSSYDGESLEACGPVALSGFPDSPPPTVDNRRRSGRLPRR